MLSPVCFRSLAQLRGVPKQTSMCLKLMTKKKTVAVQVLMLGKTDRVLQKNQVGLEIGCSSAVLVTCEEEVLTPAPNPTLLCTRQGFCPPSTSVSPTLSLEISSLATSCPTSPTCEVSDNLNLLCNSASFQAQDVCAACVHM